MAADRFSISRRQLLAGAAGAAVATPLISNGFGLARAEASAKPIKIAWNANAVCSELRAKRSISPARRSSF